MPLSPDTDLARIGRGRIPTLTVVLLMEAYRQGCDADVACELVTPVNLLVAVNLLTTRVEEKRPF